MTDFEEVVLEVRLRRDSYGRVTSTHNPQSPADEAVLTGWPSGGLEQVVFALLTETIRREALLDVILLASKDSGVLARWATSTEEEQSQMESDLLSGLQQSLSEMTRRIATPVVRDILTRMAKES